MRIRTDGEYSHRQETIEAAAERFDCNKTKAVLIGLGLLVGCLTRLAAFWGAFMMLTFYLGNWEVSHGYINGDFAYMLVFLAVAAFSAGRILGLDSYIEQYDVGGEALVERYPWLRYLLG